MAAAHGAASAYALLVLAALGITGSWGPLTSWPALLLCGRAKAPGFGFFYAFASWRAPARRGRAPCMQHVHRPHGTKVASRSIISRLGAMGMAHARLVLAMLCMGKCLCIS